MPTRKVHDKRWGNNTRLEDKKLARMRLMQAAAHCYTERGVERTSIQDVTVKAKVSRSTFYQYFSGKDDLRYAVLEYCRDGLFDRMSQEVLPYTKDFRHLFEESVIFGATYRFPPVSAACNALVHTDLITVIPTAMPEAWAESWLNYFARGYRLHDSARTRYAPLEEIASFASRLVLVYRQSKDTEASVRGNLRAFNALLNTHPVA